MTGRSDSDWCAIVEGPVPVADAEAFVRDERAGAVVVFVGTTRRFTDGRETERLEYETYVEMALRTMGELVAAARSRWPICRVALLHAYGMVNLKEASVCVAVSSPHRADSFEAARFLIDRLKGEAAIWKKELFADGTSSWVGNDSPPSVAKEREDEPADSSAAR